LPRMGGDVEWRTRPRWRRAFGNSSSSDSA
jgi:hypothetical protein